MYPLLYKYCKFSENNYDVNNLKSDILFFNTPTGYNDPYEGVISAPMVDIVEAFFIAHLSLSQPLEETIAYAEKYFSLPRLFEAISVADDIQSIKQKIFDILDEAIQHTDVDPILLTSLRLFNDDDYLKLFFQISNAALPISLYEFVIKNAICKFDDLSSFSKQTMIELLVQNYAEKYRIVNSLREKTSVVVPIYLIDAIHNTPFKRKTYEETLIDFNNATVETFENLRCLPGKIFKTTCLSENPKSILMWSHYASQHEGFCIEYDFNKAIGSDFPLDRLVKVKYSDDIPRLNLLSIIQMIRKRFDPKYVKDPVVTQLTTDTCLEAIITKKLSIVFSILSTRKATFLSKFSFY